MGEWRRGVGVGLVEAEGETAGNTSRARRLLRRARGEAEEAKHKPCTILLPN